MIVQVTHRGRSLPVAISIALIFQGACIGKSASPIADEPATPRSPQSSLVVAITLPVANQIAFVDPFRLQAWNLSSVPPSEVNALNGIADLDQALAVVGTGNDRIALLDEETGDLIRGGPLVPRSKDISIEAGWYVMGSSGHLLATADAFNGVGYLFKLDPTTLRYQGSVEIGFGQNGVALDQQDRLWTLGVEGSKGSSATTFSIVDIEAMKAHTFPLRGYPSGIARGPGGKMYITLREKARVVAVSEEGAVVESLRVGTSPWGIDIREDGLGVVVADSGNEADPRSAYIVDFNNLDIKGEIQLEGCPDAREVVITDDRAVVVCAALPGVLILNLTPAEVVGVLTFPNPRSVEQPRTPVVIDLH